MNIDSANQRHTPRTTTRIGSATGLAAALAFALVLAATAASAQPLTIPRFTFEFSNPGARSLGLGGAFAALADDATAAYANPAGLTQLRVREVSVETRAWSRSSTFFSGGRAEGIPTGRGIDTAPGITFGESETDAVGPAFASVTLPMGRWTLALYGHQLARFEQNADSQGFFFVDEPGTFNLPNIRADGTARFAPARESVDLDVTSIGVAAGLRVTDRLSIGLGVAYQDVSLRTTSDRYLPDDDSPEAVFERASFRPDRLFFESEISADDADVALQGGIKWAIGRGLSAAAFYRDGSEVFGESTTSLGPAFPIPIDLTSRNRTRFTIPEVWGIGLAYRSPDGRLTISTEADRVGYEGQISIFDEDGNVALEARGYRDATEYRLGAEYALLERTPILAFRIGAWNEENGDDLANEDFFHIAAGFGVATETFQIDFAIDLSDQTDTASLSFIYAF